MIPLSLPATAEPYIRMDVKRDEPTLYSPTERIKENHLLYVKLFEVWIYNKKTSEVIKKIKSYADD